MKAIKTTIGILASVLALNAIAQNADSASVPSAVIQSTMGQITNTYTDPYPGMMDGKINYNNTLINAELAKRDALLTSQSKLITDLQNQLNSLKTSGTGSVLNDCPAGYGTSDWRTGTIKYVPKLFVNSSREGTYYTWRCVSPINGQDNNFYW